jgi:hypothetical protein
MKPIKTAAFFLYYLSVTGCAIASTPAPNNDIIRWKFEDTVGRWSPNCAEINGINIYDQKKITIEVNSNQIYIHSTGTISDDTLTITLKSPEDLGRGGMMLEWDNFSNEKPIAKIKFISEDKSKVEWLGFYNERLKNRTWVSEPDFLTTGNNIFSRCKDQ